MCSLGFSLIGCHQQRAKNLLSSLRLALSTETAIAIEYGETNLTEKQAKEKQANKMFIELTESIQQSLYSNEAPNRIISVNVNKIESFFSEKNDTVIQLRRESIRVVEGYEAIKSLIALSKSTSEKAQSNPKGRNSR